MEKNVKFENGVLTLTKVITESDIFNTFKESRLYAFTYYCKKYFFYFCLKGEHIKFSDITLDNVLDVYLNADIYFEGYYDFNYDYANSIKRFTRKFLNSMDEDSKKYLENKDFERLLKSISCFVDGEWLDCLFYMQSHKIEEFVKHEEIFFSKLKEYLSVGDLSYFDYYIKEVLFLNYNPFFINSDKYSKKILENIKEKLGLN